MSIPERILASVASTVTLLNIAIAISQIINISEIETATEYIPISSIFIRIILIVVIEASLSFAFGLVILKFTTYLQNQALVTLIWIILCFISAGLTIFNVEFFLVQQRILIFNSTLLESIGYFVLIAIFAALAVAFIRIHFHGTKADDWVDSVSIFQIFAFLVLSLALFFR